jgi:hypothetical protein
LGCLAANVSTSRGSSKSGGVYVVPFNCLSM